MWPKSPSWVGVRNGLVENPTSKRAARPRYISLMPEERSIAVELPKTVEFPSVRLPFHVRARAGVLKPSNWFQLLRFSAVGISGYFVNLGVFPLCVLVLAIVYQLVPEIAFVVSVGNNCWWDHHWAFV